MAETSWVVEASPLIVLAKIGVAHVLDDLAPGWRVPAAVVREVLAGPAGVAGLLVGADLEARASSLCGEE